MEANYLIRTIEGNDIRTDSVNRTDHGIDYDGYERGPVAHHNNPGFVPYTNVKMVESRLQNSNPTFGVATSTQSSSEDAESSSDGQQVEFDASTEQGVEDDEKAPPDATESDSILERRVQEDNVEDINISDLPEAVEDTRDAELIRDAREQDTRKTAEPIYGERLDELSGE